MLCNCLFKDQVKDELSLWCLYSGGGTSETVISEKPSPLSVPEEEDSAWEQETTWSPASFAWPMSPVHTFGPDPSSWYHKGQKTASSLFQRTKQNWRMRTSRSHHCWCWEHATGKWTAWLWPQLSLANKSSRNVYFAGQERAEQGLAGGWGSCSGFGFI